MRPLQDGQQRRQPESSETRSMDLGGKSVKENQFSLLHSADLLKSATNYRGQKFERPQMLLQDRRPTHRTWAFTRVPNMAQQPANLKLFVASGTNILGGDGSCSYAFRIKEQAKASD